MLDEGEGLEAEEIHLHEAALLQVVHRELRGHDAGLRVLVEGDEIRQRGLAYHYARRVEAGVPILVLELPGDGEEVPVPFLLGEGAQLRLVLEGLGEGHLGVLGHELGDVVRVLEGDVQGPSHVLYDRLRLEGAEGEDLSRAIGAVLPRHVVDHLAAALIAEIDVEVRHRDPLGVEESLEEEVVLERVDVGDAQGVGHDAARARAAARPDGYAVALRPVDEVPDDEEIARELHLDDDVELVLGALPDLGADDGVAPPQALEGQVAHIFLGTRVVAGYLVVGEHRTRIGDLEIDHLRDAQSVFEGLGDLGEKRGHLVRALHVELWGVEAHPPRLVALAVGADAQEDVVGLGVGALQVVHVVGADEGQPRPLRHRDQGLVRDLLLGDAVILQLEIEAPRPEELSVAQRDALGLALLAHEDEAGNLAGDAGRARDEPLRVPREKLEVYPRLVIEALGIGGGGQLEEVPVALGVSGEQDEVPILVAVLGARALEARAPRHVELHSDYGLYPRFPAGVVELYGSEHVAVVGQGKGAHAQGLGPGDHAAHGGGPIEEGEVGMVVEMDELGHGCGLVYR